MNRGVLFTAALLFLLTGLMAGHLVLLGIGARECESYQRILLKRLDRSAIGSAEAVALRKEIQEYLSGVTTECANAEEDYERAADKYIAMILALMGAGAYAVASGSGPSGRHD